jgi:hypothetical protein
MAVVRCFQRKREPEGRFWGGNAAGTGEIARRRLQTPGEAQKRPRLRAPQNAERRFHLATMVEETGAMNKHSPPPDEGADFQG